MNVYTNLVDFEIDYENLEKSFFIYSLDINSLNMLNRLKQESLSSYFFDSRVYFLTKRELIKVRKESFCSLNKRVVFNLLIKTLPKSSSFFNAKYDINALFYLVSATKRILKTISFEIKEEVEGLFLSIKAVAFKYSTSCKSCYKISGKYVVLSKDGKYERGNYPNKKLSVPFFAISSKFTKSKSYYLAIFLKDLKKIPYIKRFRLIQKNMNVLRDDSYSRINLNKNSPVKKIEAKIKDKISVVNIINPENFDISNLKALLKSENIKVALNNEDFKYNLLVTKDKSDYKSTDPYMLYKKKNPYLQAINYTTLKDINKSKLYVLLKELLIKDDLKTKVISLSDKANPIKKIYAKAEDGRVYSLEFNDKNILTLKKEDMDFESEEMILEDINGNINAIYKTSLYTLPNISGCAEYFNSLDDSSKFNPRKKDRFSLISSIHYIKYFKSPSFGYYVTGYLKNSKEFPKAHTIKRVEAVKGELFLDKIIQSIDEFFVKNKEYTSFPYQLKYLRELVNMEKIIRS